MGPAARISPYRFQCFRHLPVLAAYDDRTHGYLVTGLVHHGTAARRLSPAARPRGRVLHGVGRGQLFVITFDARLDRYLGVFFREDANGAARLQLEQLGAGGAFRGHGETLPDPRNAAIGPTSIIYARNVDETLVDWTVQYGGYSEEPPPVNHLYADVLAGDRPRRLRHLELVTVIGGAGAIAAYDPRDRRFLGVWSRLRHGSPVTEGELIAARR